MENITIETTYINDIKIVKEISTDSEDPYTIEDHYNKDNFNFYHKFTNTICKEFWFKSPYWTKTIDYDPNRDVTLIYKYNSDSVIFLKDKCQTKVTKKIYKTNNYDIKYNDVNMGFMIDDIK